MLWKKKTPPLRSEEFEELTKRLIVLKTDIEVMQGKMSSLETQLRSLRTKVARAPSDDEETDNSKYSDPFEWVRRNKNGLV